MRAIARFVGVKYSLYCEKCEVEISSLYRNKQFTPMVNLRITLSE